MLFYKRLPELQDLGSEIGGADRQRFGEVFPALRDGSPGYDIETSRAYLDMVFATKRLAGF